MPSRMRMMLLSIAGLLACCFPAQAKVHQVNFVINSPGSPPFLYFDRNAQRYEGVVVDFFDSFAAQANVNVKYQDSSRARNERFLRQGKADMFLSGAAWLDSQEGFVFSDTIMTHDSYLYATTAFNGPFDPPEHAGESVCTRFGFVYPVLQKHFDDKAHGLTRVNSTSQTTMAMMLSKGRCDYAIMSEENALSVLNKPQFCDTEFHQSPNVISKVDLVLVIRQERAELQPIINRYLADFIQSGQLAVSIERHSGSHHFPKLKCS